MNYQIVGATAWIGIWMISIYGIIYWAVKYDENKRKIKRLTEQQAILEKELKEVYQQWFDETFTLNNLADSLVQKLQGFYEQHELVECNDGKMRAKCTIEK